VIVPFLPMEVLCGLSIVIGLWHKYETGAIRGMWRIPDKRVECGLFLSLVCAQKVVAPT
jgi:hypothetical protein